MRSVQRMATVQRLVTAGELERYPEDDFRYELVEGRVIRMSPVGYRHGRTVMRLGTLFEQHLAGREDGVVLTDVGFVLATGPDTVRAPDLAFVRRDRIPSPDPRGYLQGPPDVAVEVASPEDRPSSLRAKAQEYLARGVLVVLQIDPDVRRVIVCRRLAPPLVLTNTSDVVDLGDAIPGFRCALGDLFD